VDVESLTLIAMGMVKRIVLILAHSIKIMTQLEIPVIMMKMAMGWTIGQTDARMIRIRHLQVFAVVVNLIPTVTGMVHPTV
jgi:hypothetical protein